MHFLKTLYLVPVSRLVITKSTQSYPVHLRTLDSIHLSTALLLAGRKSQEIPLLTHDLRLAQAAKVMGLEAIDEA